MRLQVRGVLPGLDARVRYTHESACPATMHRRLFNCRQTHIPACFCSIGWVANDEMANDACCSACVSCCCQTDQAWSTAFSAEDSSNVAKATKLNQPAVTLCHETNDQSNTQKGKPTALPFSDKTNISALLSLAQRDLVCLIQQHRSSNQGHTTKK